MQRAFNSIFFSTLPLASLGCLIPLTTQAQVTPDGTTSTTVNQDGNNFIIEQGDRINDNLFHSFNEFSVPTLGSAAFNNASDIANIFSRVTGSNISSIDGLLSANGAANLFLINPNGIIFGENASLNLGGSFFASTADSLLFEGDTEFSAVNPQAPPLLEVSIPIGLNFRDNPGEIVNRSFVRNSTGDFAGLEVLSGKNLTLLGGNINFEAGNTTARDGTIELGGISEAGIVSINDDGSLNFPENVAQADITLRNFADVNVSGTGGGSIIVNARNVNLEAGDFGSSLIRAGIIADSTSSEAQAGDITINATENITVDESSILNLVAPEAVGDAGGVTITTGSLSLTNGGQVAASTLGQGNAGLVEITATDTITIDGEQFGGFPSNAISRVEPGAVGDAGGVTITTGSLSLTNGGLVDTSTTGEGNAGLVKINATDTITIDGEDSGGSPSAANSIVNSRAVGNAGGVNITTGSLSLTNGGQVAASTLGQGNAGLVEITATDTITIDGEQFGGFPSSAISRVELGAVGDAGGVTITTGSLSLINGGLVAASTLGQGDAGNVIVNAKESINISGSTERFRSGVSADALISSGNGGSINVFTNKLTIENGGTIEASNFDSIGERTPGTGEPGDINIQANSLSLSNKARIDAVTQAETGDNANINLQIADDIILRNSSFISAQALGNANGGNLTIDTDFIIAFPNQNSDIIASAAQGNGGNININAESLFGIEERPLNPFTNDINASSEFGLQGDIAINTPEVDPTSGLINLPEAVGDASDQISQNPCEQGVGSEFTITGKGGLPPNVNESLNSESAQVSLIETVPSQHHNVAAQGLRPKNAIRSNPSTTQEVVPAQGWVFNDQGKVTLTAYSTSDQEIKRSGQKHHSICKSGI